jgi:hypothetical protein
MAKTVEVQSRWTDTQGNYFQIIHVIMDDKGHEWVHYRRERDAEEFSCWTESFLQRFQETPHDARSTYRFGF